MQNSAQVKVRDLVASQFGISHDTLNKEITIIRTLSHRRTLLTGILRIGNRLVISAKMWYNTVSFETVSRHLTVGLIEEIPLQLNIGFITVSTLIA